MSDVKTRKIEAIVIHCSATPQGQNVTVYDVDKWHAARGFKRAAAAVKAYNPSLPHIGYHYLIDLQGRCYSGRAELEIGAHVVGRNTHSIGVCMAGTDRFTPGQWASLAGLVADLAARYPGALVTGHRDLSPDRDGDGLVEPHEWLKTCPGFHVVAWRERGMVPMPQNVVSL